MTHGIKVLLAATSAVLVAGVIFTTWMFKLRRDIPIPDEKAAAMALLIEKLSGPRYFSAPVTGIHNSDGPWIDVEEAVLQEERVILERHWENSQRAQVDRLISQLSEPKPARMVGGYWIPLERLNLALDTIKK